MSEENDILALCSKPEYMNTPSSGAGHLVSTW